MSKKKIASYRGPSAKTSHISRAVDALKRGNVIVFPTETLYGIGADGLDPLAVEKVFELKGREPDKPLPLLVADEEMLAVVVKEISPTARKLILAFWPGPLTLILPARRGIPEPLINDRGGVAVRISSRATATQLVRSLGRPLTATSANPSGEKAARTIAEARKYFGDQVSVYVNGGMLASKAGSTVVEIKGRVLSIIREGEIQTSEIKRVLSTKNRKPKVIAEC
ncbi:MAG TPA: L-threonylcarbamoyladenylate synthase [Terriglobales bacterium]|nr:L-threonylcarbamoyladenylate synthase [Terriglobales bacterium]